MAEHPHSNTRTDPTGHATAGGPAHATGSPYAPPTAALELRPGVVPQAASEIAFAGFWRRLAGALVDGFVLVAIVLGVTVAKGGFGPLTEGLVSPFQILVVAIPTWLAYLAVAQARPFGATLGKRAVSTKLVRGNGEMVSLGRALLRTIVAHGASIATLGVGYLILAFAIPFNARRQSLHDRVFDTVVVDRHAFTTEPLRQQHGVNAATLAVLAIAAGLVLWLGAWIAIG